jgi:hypothetical protein
MAQEEEKYEDDFEDVDDSELQSPTAKKPQPRTEAHGMCKKRKKEKETT